MRNLPIALDTTSDVRVITSRHRNLRVGTGAGELAVGFVPIAVPADDYFWLVKEGPTAAIAGEAIATSTAVLVDLRPSTGGKVGLRNAANDEGTQLVASFAQNNAAAADGYIQVIATDRRLIIMAGPERALPYRDVFWANTQKHTISAYHDRWLLLGATIGKDDELVIVRHDLSGLMDSVQLGATVASQTGLHINIKDQRDVIALKLSKHEDNNAEFITLYNVADDGTETATGGAADGGAWADASLRELKSDMKDLTETRSAKSLISSRFIGLSIPMDEMLSMSPQRLKNSIN